MKAHPLFLIIISISLITGCSSSQPYSLRHAQTELVSIKNDPFIVKNAPLEINEAERTLSQAFQIWNETEDKSRTSDVARKALTQINTARVQAGKNATAEVSKEAQYSEQLYHKQQMIAHLQQDALSQQAENHRILINQLSELKRDQLQQQMLLSLNSDLLFDVDRTSLKPGARRELTPLLDFLRNHPQHTIKIEGHTDNTGDDSYNRALSEKRADAVKSYLIRNGIADWRIKAKGLGESYPVASNDTTAGRLQNRRVEVLILPS
ncbi:MAG: OmpA family protein [Bdellovibrionales bacterium]|nr:OmpA family protein [Bdellovibrionales bacterium]